MKKLNKIISFIMCCILTFSFTACKPKKENSNDTTPPSTEESQPGGESGGDFGGGVEDDDWVEPLNMSISSDYEDYIGDLEVFTYGLLINKLEYLYDVFPGYIELSNTDIIYGLAYTDYSKCYTNEDETVAYFETGFLPFVGELDVPQEEFDNGLYVYNLDYQDENTVFIWSQKSDEFYEHCVVYGAYLKYGVSAEGQITYSAAPFEREVCDTSLGSLYSYDDSRYLYDDEFGNYLPVSGISLFETFDYEEFEKEINAFIEEQNESWMTFDIESVASTSHEAVNAYLLSLQEETFFGFSVDLLIEESAKLDALECFRVTPEGLKVVDIEPEPPEEASSFVKWLVGGACVIVAGVGIVGSIITSACPALSAIASAATGVAIEMFMQVVVDGKTLGDVSWSKVGIAAASGAVSGFLGPYIQTLGGAASFFVDTAVDGLIGATEQAIFALLDGEKGKDVLKQFGYGFALGAGLSAGFKIAGKVVSKAGQGLSNAAQKINGKLSPKLAAGLAAFTKPIKNIGNAIGDTVNSLKKKADGSIFSSRFIVNSRNGKQVTKLIAGEINENKLSNKSIRYLKPDGILDIDGNAINKNQLKKVFETAENGDVVGQYKMMVGESEETVNIVKKNSTYNVVFDKENYLTVELTNGQVNNRNKNFIEASKKYIDIWTNEPAKMPQEIKDELLKLYPGREIDDIFDFADMDELSRQVRDIVSKSSYVFHESADLVSIQLVSRELHDKVRGYNGISHMGGIGLLKYLKSEYGVTNAGEYAAAAASGIRVKLVFA